jgi:precorrin-3B synthase
VVARLVGDTGCPGALHAVAARDGLLARVRIPGGIVTFSQVRTLADIAECDGDGHLDITSRASVQLRGLSATTHAACTAALTAAGLVPSESHERIRNIVASPLAGVDPRERVDARPLVRELDARIVAEPSFAALPAKFCFALDGGGEAFDDGGADLALRAVALAGETVFHLMIGGVATGLVTPPETAVETLILAARSALAFASRDGLSTPWRLARLPEARTAIVSTLRSQAYVSAGEAPPIATVSSAIPFGIASAREAGRVNVIPTIPLGRLTAHQARGLAAMAEVRRGELRFAPWRGVVLADIARDDVPYITAELARLGIALDGSDGYAGIAACAGIAGCGSALADVRGDAARLAARLASTSAQEPTEWRVNVAGCEKRCAMRRGASVELIATTSGYNIVRDGALVATGCTPEAALTYTVEAHRAQRGEVFA